MIRNIVFFFAMGDFNCNKDKELFDLWDKQESVINKRIEIIDKCLDVYDIIFPYNRRKPILSKYDLRPVYNLMDRLFYDTAYPVMDETGVDLNMELGCPGWLDLKKLLLRFFSKINLEREFGKFEEEVEGTGHMRPIRIGKWIKIMDGPEMIVSVPSLDYSSEEEEEEKETDTPTEQDKPKV